MPMELGETRRPPRGRALLGIVLVIATLGLVYELAIATVASYLLGDSVTQFSTVIGVYLSALGIGAYLSRYVSSRLALTFVDIELSAGLIGGTSAPALFITYAYTDAFRFLLYAWVLFVGILIGLELPLLIRILRKSYDLKELVAQTLTFDYLGALLGSLGFSLLFVPSLGLVHTTLMCGILSALVGLLSTWILADFEPDADAGLRQARGRAVGVLLCLSALWFLAPGWVNSAEEETLGANVIVREQTPYQRVVVSKQGDDLRLILNGHLQLSSLDEYRYHEALVHPAMALATAPRRVLIAGGGDGCALREVLKWPTVSDVVLVELDARVAGLFRDVEQFARLNHESLRDPRVTLIHQDAMIYAASHREPFDVAIVDFPDPSTFSLGKLYSTRFYARLKRLLGPDGTLAVQATSPLFATRAFWCIVTTLEAVGFKSLPYHAFVPSFGEWGFVLATQRPKPWPQSLPRHLSLRYLTPERLSALPVFSSDMQRVETSQNTLNNQLLVHYYLQDWNRVEG